MENNIGIIKRVGKRNIESYIFFGALEGLHDEVFGEVAVEETLRKLRTAAADKSIKTIT
jgi:hypothetical protein